MGNCFGGEGKNNDSNIGDGKVRIEDLNFGDIIFVGGANAKLHSELIVLVQNLKGIDTKFSHSAMVFKEKGSNELMLFQSTKDGVVIENLKEYVEHNKKRLFGVKRTNDKNGFSEEMIEIARKFAEKHKGKKYETNFFELAMSIFDGNGKENNQAFFCSELIASLLKELGILVTEENTNNIVPGELQLFNDPKNIYEKELKILQKGNEIDAQKMVLKKCICHKFEKE